MNFLKKIILVFIFLFPISNSYGVIVTHVQTGTFEDDHQEDEEGARDGIIAGIEFNKDGTKMFTIFGFDPLSPADDYHMINEYNLSTPYDISTKTYAGTTERCELGNGTEIFIPKLKSYDLTQVKNILFDLFEKTDSKNVGIRPGEKLHETLINVDEMRSAWLYSDIYMILKDEFSNDYIQKTYPGISKLNITSSYSSDNSEKLGDDELKKTILDSNMKN